MSELNSFVEAVVTCIQFEKEKRQLRIEVSCVWEGKNRRAITARGVDDLLVDDLRPYNIVDRVTLFPSEDAVETINRCSSSLFSLMQRRELQPNDLEWPAFKEKLASIRSGNLRLMEIEPVCGASVIVLAEEIHFESISS